MQRLRGILPQWFLAAGAIRGGRVTAAQLLRASVMAVAYDSGRLAMKCSKTESWRPPQARRRVGRPREALYKRGDGDEVELGFVAGKTHNLRP
jgi:hypothetical protein